MRDGDRTPLTCFFVTLSLIIRIISGGYMRLDKYLKVSRLIKRRTVAKEAADGGKITINGKTAKASSEVKPGDIIEIGFGNKTVRAEMLELRENVRAEEAGTMYKLLSEHM